MVAETADTTLVLKERDTFLRQSPVPSISTTVCEVKYNEPKQQKKKKEEKKRKKSQSLMII